MPEADLQRWGRETVVEITTATDRFDAEIQTVTQARGQTYGHPSVDFSRASRIIDVVNECPEPVVRQALSLIATKIARLIETPDHVDSLIDIAGYARTICMHVDNRSTSSDDRHETSSRATAPLPGEFHEFPESSGSNEGARSGGMEKSGGLARAGSGSFRYKDRSEKAESEGSEGETRYEGEPR